MGISVQWRKNLHGNTPKMRVMEAGESISAGDVVVPGSGGDNKDEVFVMDATGETILGVAMNTATDGNDVAVVVASRDDLFEFVSSSAANFTDEDDYYQDIAMDVFTSGAQTANPSTRGNDIRGFGRVKDDDSDNDDATNANRFLGVFKNTYYDA
jgi:hypothetical protein